MKVRALGLFFLLSLARASSTLASSPTGAAFLAEAVPPAATDADSLVQVVAMSKTKALSGRDVAIQSRLRVQLLLERRRQIQASLLAGQGQLFKHQQAGSTAYKRFQTSQKARGTPPSSATESLETARTEYEAAVKKASALVEQTLDLANIDEQIPKAVAQAAEAAAEAKSAADAAGSALAKLKSMADATVSRIKLIAEEARKAAATAQEEAGKARALAGGGSPEAHRAKKAQDDRDLSKQKAQLAELSKSLASVQAAITTAPGAPSRDARPE